MPIPAGADRLAPLDRAEFDLAPVRWWRITWPDGTTEVVEGHTMQRNENFVAFHWSYLGLHRIVNLAHVRDVEELHAPSDA